MKKLTVLLTIAAMTLVMVAPASIFAAGDSFRSQATAGQFDDDAIDDIGDAVDVIKSYPKWVLLTRFSNLLGTVNGDGSTSEDNIFQYGAGANSDHTFYGLMGSSEWFETNLGMPVNFAISYERNGSRTDKLDHDDNSATAAVYSADGDGFTDSSSNAVEYSKRTSSLTTSLTEWTLTGGYKIEDGFWAGAAWIHSVDKTNWVNSGDRTVTVATVDTDTTYGNGLSGDVLTYDASDVLDIRARKAINDDIHVKGYVELGIYRGQDNTVDYTSAGQNGAYENAAGDSLPWAEEASTGNVDTNKTMEVSSKMNGIIFALAGKVYYYPVYKGSIESKAKYKYKGGAISKSETYTEEVTSGTDTETTNVLSGKQAEHTLSLNTDRNIELDGIDVVMSLNWERKSSSTTGTVAYDFSDNNTSANDNDHTTKVTDKTVTHTWGFPIGAELAVKEKWTVRVGADHSVALSTRTVDTDYSNATDYTNKTVTKNVTRSTAYTYGVGYAWSENLQIDVNAFLEETGEAGDNQSIFDLATYRNLAVSAALIF